MIARTMRESNARDYAPDRLEALIAYCTAHELHVLAQERYCLVATHDGDVIATAARDRSELATFFVRPDYQGRGVRTRLLAALEQEPASIGLDELRVDVSLTGGRILRAAGLSTNGGEARWVGWSANHHA